MARLVLRNIRIFDGYSDKLIEGQQICIDGDTIASIEPLAEAVPDDPGAEVIDCGGRVAMPGMIDAHVHAYVSGIGLSTFDRPMSYHAQHGAVFLRHILRCGFTTVRDAGGADVGIATALKEKLIEGPRLFYSGHIISQTGGHGDPRSAFKEGLTECCGCGFGHVNHLSVVVDGADRVMAAVREEFRRGASFIKIMGSGGVSSPNDPIDRCQFSDAEVSAAVEEANRWGHYVAAHCHPAEGIKRLLRLGVRSVEHGTLIDREGADLSVQQNAFIVPTMATIFALLDDGPTLGMSPASYDKLQVVAEQALSGLQLMRDAGVQMGFGTDLLGPLYKKQGTEFTLRARVLSNLDILRSACSVNAALLGEEGRLGCIAPGAVADILLVDGDPLADIAVLARPEGEGIAGIIQDGAFVKRGF